MHKGRIKRHGHEHRVKARNGAGTINVGGYSIFTETLGFRKYSRKYEHIQLAEKALGKKLPKGAVVHHVNGNTSHAYPVDTYVHLC